MLPQVDIRSLYSRYYNVFALTFLSTSLVIKLPFTRRITGFPLGRLLFADAAMSAASSLLQAPVIPGAMILSSLILTPIFGTNENAPIIWLSVVSVTTVTSASIEALVLHSFFAQRISPKAFCLLCTANAICMAGAIYGMYRYALAHPPEA
jgi:hypothetical protein